MEARPFEHKNKPMQAHISKSGAVCGDMPAYHELMLSSCVLFDTVAHATRLC